MTCPADVASRAPQTTGSRMALLLAFVSGAAVANVYYAQPLLDDLGSQLGMSAAALGWVTTAPQGGWTGASVVGVACAVAALAVGAGDRLIKRPSAATTFAPGTPTTLPR